MTWVFEYDHRHDLDPAEVTLLLGGKAANLSVMAVDLGLPVPPAFTISTEACRAFLADGWPGGLDEELRAHMTRLEALVGRGFGDPRDPLLVSVRSGAPRSMPGMMDTILNLGLNPLTEIGLAAASGNPAFARDCRDRLERIYRDVVGVDEIPDDPWLQLRGAIEAVFRSWNSDRARTYRAHEGISDDLGTGVTVQAMVFGNRGPKSGTGVLFTRNPATGERAHYGDVLFEAQGEDVVAGTHATATIEDLERRMPGVAAELRDYADRLEYHYRDCCDIEFTIERGRLWMLQTRVGKRTPQAALRMAVEMAEDPSFPLTREEAVRRVLPLLTAPPTVTSERADVGPALTVGLGASPGVVAGRIRLTPDEAVAAADRGEDVILVRAETSPDDVHGMGRSRGILTSTGGFASHAAVVARGWGIPAVVGAADVVVGDAAVTIGERAFAPGDELTIDGSTGEVFAGAVAGVTTIVPEAAVLLAWAEELGVPVPAPAAPVGESSPVGNDTSRIASGRAGGASAGEASQAGDDTSRIAPLAGEDALRILVVKGYAGPDAMALATGSDPADATAVLEALVGDGLAEAAAGSYRLTEAGREAGRALVAADAAAWGADRASAALDAFLSLDRRMKDTVTAWQVREVDGTQVANDHSDAMYDAAILGRLAVLHADVRDWLQGLDGAPARMAGYAARLGDAAARAAAGEGKYVASPRVDSYHGIWFELHEDLILLAGRSRAEEAAAGRA